MTNETPIPGHAPGLPEDRAQLAQAEDTIGLLRSHLEELSRDLRNVSCLMEGLDPLNDVEEVDRGGIMARRARNARTVLIDELIERAWAIQGRAETAAKDC